ncbi:MAG: hypothetical protein FWF72_01875 [Paludibacter sp.]|nr:hypothetical protein [Paludibacter sp.]
MKKNSLLIAALIFAHCVFSQNKENEGVFISSLGIGYQQRYNEMMFPYEFSGTKYSLNLEWQMLHSDKLLSDAKFNIGYSSLFAKTSAANVLAFNAMEHCLVFDFKYQLMRKVIDNHKLKLFAGGSLKLLPEYEILLDMRNIYTESLTNQFIAMDLSLGAAVFAQYQLEKFRITDNFSFPLIAGAFYPYYQIPPFYYSGNYFIVATIGKLNRMSNYLSFEFPVYVKGKLLNTYYLGYNFNYEYSTIRDNLIRRFEHNILLGIRFKITK